jgi:hypothetical protein
MNAKKYPGKPVVQVEIGNFLQAEGLDRDLKNQWVWQGLKRLKLDVINLGEDDIAALSSLDANFARDERFISANLLARSTGEPLVRPFLVKQISLPGTEKKLRLGFLGLSSRPLVQPENFPYLWADPIATAAKWLPILRAQCDFLIIVACLPSRDAVQLAINNKDVDIILDGYKHQFYSPFAQINQSRICYAEDEGKMLGELRFIVKRGEPIQATPLEYPLTSNIQDDPDMAAFLATAKADISQAQNLLARNSAPPAANSGTAGSPPAPSSFLTFQACLPCHGKVLATWSNSGHARALETLKRVKKEFDSSCVSCHSTGFGKPGGFIDLYKTPLMANVQCESCHGAGREHIANPASVKMKTKGEATCLVCHTKSNSPDFQFGPYWKKIFH